MIEFDAPETEEYRFHQNKSPISINDIDINKKIASNKLSFGSQDFKYFLATKILEKLNLDEYSVHK